MNRANLSAFRGQRAFVTGGSSGIGKATAAALAGFGAHVVIGARHQGRLEKACQEIRSHAPGGTGAIDWVRLDVSDPSDAERGVAEAIERLRGIDILVNSAGVAHAARFEETPHEEFDRMMAVNYFGTVNVTRAVLLPLKVQRSGHIANVSSVAGFMGIFGYTAYAPSKFAVTGFSEALRQELLPYGIAVSVLFPPDTDTPQLAQENRTKPAETRAIAGNVRVMSAESVALALLSGMARGRFRIVPGRAARLTELANRHLPGLVRWTIDRSLGRTPS